MPNPTRPFVNFISAMALAAPLLIGLSVPVLADQDDDDDRDRGPRHGSRSPKVVLISLDGAKPDLIQKYLDQGVLPRDGGLAELNKGVVARQNVTQPPRSRPSRISRSRPDRPPRTTTSPPTRSTMSPRRSA